MCWMTTTLTGRMWYRSGYNTFIFGSDQEADPGIVFTFAGNNSWIKYIRHSGTDIIQGCATWCRSNEKCGSSEFKSGSKQWSVGALAKVYAPMSSIQIINATQKTLKGYDNIADSSETVSI